MVFNRHLSMCDLFSCKIHIYLPNTIKILFNKEMYRKIDTERELNKTKSWPCNIASAFLFFRIIFFQEKDVKEEEIELV